MPYSPVALSSLVPHFSVNFFCRIPRLPLLFHLFTMDSFPFPHTLYPTTSLFTPTIDLFKTSHISLPPGTLFIPYSGMQYLTRQLLPLIFLPPFSFKFPFLAFCYNLGLCSLLLQPQRGLCLYYFLLQPITHSCKIIKLLHA